MNLSRYVDALEQARPLRVRGKVSALAGLAVRAAVAGVRLGECVEIRTPQPASLLAEVVGLREGEAVLMPLGEVIGIGLDSEVVPTGRPLAIGVGSKLRGRVLDGLGRPLDGNPLPAGLQEWPVDRPAPSALSRGRISRPLSLGVRAIDGLLTVGEGQRLGIFAGSGVGKSALLGQIVRGTRADIAVVGLVGERGREVQEFIQEYLGEAGLHRSVVVAATSDAPALVRLKAAQVATAIAEWFAEIEGHSVLLVLDSLTRVARAQRDVGLAAGEPPVRQGYPPSVFGVLPRLLERAGRRERGVITGLYAVLVAGGDMEEPIADEVRGLLDGHVVLDRRLSARGHWPAIDVLQSLSRLMPAVTSHSHRAAADRLRDLLSTYEQHRDLIALGAYRPGSDARIDESLTRIGSIEEYLRQGTTEQEPFEETVARLERLFAAGV
jgi:ATP synthase in type III secretion protein N